MLEAAVTIRLPFDAESLLGYLAPRLFSGIEEIAGGHYRRVLDLDSEPVLVDVDVAAAAVTGEARVVTSASAAQMLEVLRRVDWLLDGGWDPLLARETLGSDALLRPLIGRRPGLRVPGTMVPFETVVRAVVGQQISVAGATTLTQRLVKQFGQSVEMGAGGLSRAFPGPAALGSAPLEEVGLTRARADAIRSVASEVACGRLELERSAEAAERLLAIKGIGPWTAAYVGLRALGDRDSIPVSDLGIRQALGGGAPVTVDEAARRSDAWRPFRGIAAAHLWTELIANRTTRG